MDILKDSYSDSDDDDRSIECESSDDDDRSIESESSDDESTETNKEEYYRVLKEDDIKQKQEEAITLLSSSLSVSRITAAILLQNYMWNVEKAQEAWFNNEDGVRESVGLPKYPCAGFRNDLLQVCGICFENYDFDMRLESTVGFCGHSFCGACLETYITTSISDGPGCLFLRCPDPSCRATIGQDIVNLLVSDENKNKYKQFMFRSYVETNKKTKWCPAPGCECAIECQSGSQSYDVTCHCLHSFCWHCLEDSHRPVECETVGKWIAKNNCDSENVTWMLANSKPCPKCEVPIEKNHGCMHMTCKLPCGYQFCWICLGPWIKHDSSSCNTYKDMVKKGECKVEKVRANAKREIMRYAHYYERWDANHKSRMKALADLHVIKMNKLEQLENKHCQAAGQLKFVTEAWEQIVECRRVLKWTYAYGYFMPFQEASLKTELFEYLQGAAEVALERLHHCAETNLETYLGDDADSNEFNTEFRVKLANLTRVTGRYFANFVKGIENGLSEAENMTLKPKNVPMSLDGVWECQRCTYLNDAEHNTCYACYVPYATPQDRVE